MLVAHGNPPKEDYGKAFPKCVTDWKELQIPATGVYVPLMGNLRGIRLLTPSDSFAQLLSG